LARLSNTFSAAESEVRPRRDHRGVDLISDALPFGRLSYGAPVNDAATRVPTV
jgi:hypothetical protein